MAKEIIDRAYHWDSGYSFLMLTTEGKRGGLKHATRKNILIIATPHFLISQRKKIDGGRGIDVLYRDTAIYSTSKNATNGPGSDYGRAVTRARGEFHKVIDEFWAKKKAEADKKAILESLGDMVKDRKPTVRRRM